MQVAIDIATKSKVEVPVGAVVVLNGKVIAKAHNTNVRTKLSTNHAEVIAINKACKKLKTWHLDDCEIYTTVEPCIMCYGAIKQSRIKKIVFGTENEKFGFISNQKDKSKIQFESGIMKKECCEILQKFFFKKRT